MLSTNVIEPLTYALADDGTVYSQESTVSSSISDWWANYSSASESNYSSASESNYSAVSKSNPSESFNSESISTESSASQSWWEERSSESISQSRESWDDWEEWDWDDEDPDPVVQSTSENDSDDDLGDDSDDDSTSNAWWTSPSGSTTQTDESDSGEEETSEQPQINYNKYWLAVLAQKLWIDWNNDSEKWAIVAWVEDKYYGTREQNEQIRLFLVANADKVLSWEINIDNVTLDKEENKVNNKDNAANNESEVDNDDNNKDSSNGWGSNSSSSSDDSTTWEEVLWSWDISPLSILSEAVNGKKVEWENVEWEDVESLTWDVVEELTWNALELSIAWETLNEKPITESKRYNKVSVDVEAPKWTFPEGTYADIQAIKSKTQLNEIKQQISGEDNTVSEDSDIVAFDIRFLYKLSDSTEVEVQPKENTVKVTFDYEDNKSLSKADKDDEQEVKVFHIDDKDENGEKVEKWEEKVVEVTNKVESAEDGIAVADAESFSIYAIVYWNENPLLEATILWDDDDRNNFKYKTITISDWTNSYTIMDRNLGAKEPWDGVTWNGNNIELDSYWYYYDVQASQQICNYWISEAADVRNNCNNTDPCPTGWHMPSKTEWNNLISVWRNYGGKSTSEDSESKNFAKDLKLPPAGQFINKLNPYTLWFEDRGSYWYYHSSDFYEHDKIRGYFTMSTTDLSVGNNLDTQGYNVRCFKDSANSVFTVNFDSKEWSEVDSQTVTLNSTATEPEDPTKDGYTFAGWYSDEELTQAFDFDTTINEDITLYAKWNISCSDWFHPNAQWTECINTYTITFVDEDGTTVLQSSEVTYGTTPAYSGETPTKAATSQYTYTFNGWTPGIVAVAGDATYTATYNSTVNKYTVKWNVEWVDVETDENVEYGTTPTYDWEEPTKAATPQYTYTFAGWDPVVSTVQGNTTYTAQFNSTERIWHTLTLNANWWTVDLWEWSTVKSIEEGDSFTVPAATHDNYEFMWWYEDTNNNSQYDAWEERWNSEWYTINSMSSNLTLIARWGVTVTYDAWEGWSSDKQSDTGEVWTSVTLPWATHQQWKLFGGWDNGWTELLEQGSEYELTRTETLFAQWYDYTVTFATEWWDSVSAEFANNWWTIDLPTSATVKKSGFILKWRHVDTNNNGIYDEWTDWELLTSPYLVPASQTLVAEWEELSWFEITISSNNSSYWNVSPSVLQGIVEWSTISKNGATLTIDGQTVTATAETNPIGSSALPEIEPKPISNCPTCIL